MGDTNSQLPGIIPNRSAEDRWAERAREWRSRLAILVAGVLAFETLSGQSVWLLPFGIPNQVMVIVHTVLGLLFLIPVAWYLLRHFLHYWRNTMSHILLLGYLGAAAVILCAVSGLVLTYQSALGVKISYAWDAVHSLTINTRLRYRKVDQYLLNFLFGKDKGLTAPVTDMAQETKIIQIIARAGARTAGM
ncbi:MAG: hypothetical protein ABSG54_05965 [Terriglobia bacterium]|jgi:hypothetical protein